MKFKANNFIEKEWIFDLLPESISEVDQSETPLLNSEMKNEIA